MRLRILSTLSLALVAFASAARADTVYRWTDPNGNSYNWGTAGNWSGAGNAIAVPTSYLNALYFDRDADGQVNNNVAGGVYLSTLALANQNWAFVGNDLHFAATSTLSSAGGTSTIANAVRIDAPGTSVTAGTLTLSGGISGAGGLAKTGAGNLVLSGAATYTGSTDVREGVLTLRAANALPTGGSLNVALGAIAQLGLIADLAAPSYAQTVGGLSGGGIVYLGDARLTVGDGNASSTFSGLLSGNAGGLTKTGTGTLTLAGSRSYGGDTRVEGGTLRVASATALGGNVVLNGGTLDLQADATVNSLSFDRLVGTTYVNAGSVTGSGTLTLTGDLLVPNQDRSMDSAGTIATGLSLAAGNHAVVAPAGGVLSVSGPVSGAGGLAIGTRGPAVLTLSGADTYAGGTTVGGSGTLNVAAPHGAYAIAKGGNVNSTNSDARSLSALSGQGTLQMSGKGTLSLPDSPTFSGTVIAKSGTLVFNSPNALGSIVSVSRGATLANGAPFGGSATVAATAYLNGTVRTDAGRTTTFSGNVKLGSTVELTSGLLFAGTGRVEFQGDVDTDTLFGNVSFEGDVALAAGSSLDLLVTPNGQTTGLRVAGALSLAGSLNVYPGFLVRYAAGQSFDILDFGTLTGRFSSVALPSLSSGLVWNTSALYTTGTISVQAVPEPATLAALGLGSLALFRRRRKG